MKALVKSQKGPGFFSLTDWPEPVLLPGHVLVRVEYAGICGTDVSIVAGRWRCNPPVVLGHEYSGVVAEVGEGVTSVQKGDAVVGSNPARTCLSCFHCRVGNPFMCANLISRGYTIDGAFTELIRVEERSVWKLPAGLSLREAALCEPLAGAARAMTERVSIHAGDVVLISGPGPVGLLCLALVKLQGATAFLCGTSKDERRLAFGKELGADVVMNVDESPAETIIPQTPRGGVDVAVEAAGVGASLSSCLKAVRKGGAVVQIGIYGSDVQSDLAQIVMKELNFVGSYGYLWSSWDRSLRLLAEKKIPARKFLAEDLPLDQWERGFSQMQAGEAIKILLRPNEA